MSLKYEPASEPLPAPHRGLPREFVNNPDLNDLMDPAVQGYLAHKKHPPPRTLQ